MQKNVPRLIIEACSVDELLKDRRNRNYLNLTIPRAHYEVAKNPLIMENMFIVKNPWLLILLKEKNFLSKSKGLYIGNAPRYFSWWRYSKIY